MIGSGLIMIIRDEARKGKSAYRIAKENGISKNTVKKYLNNKELPGRTHKRSSLLDPFKSQINQMMADGLFNCTVILESLKNEGYSDEIEKYKNDPFTYNAQYLQVPLDDVGKLFKKDKLQFSQSRPAMSAMRLCISVDASGKGDIGNDFNTISVIGRTATDYYILEVLNFHADITLLVQKVKEVRARWGSFTPVVIEARANGLAAIQILRKEMSGILEIHPVKDKVERAIVVKYLFDSNNVFFAVRGLVWGEIQAQFTQFPHGKNDDIVDSVVQGITWLMQLPAFQLGAQASRPSNVSLRRPVYGQRNSNGSTGYRP